MIPLYGFLEGDTLGLLILAEPQDTVQQLAEKLQSAASVRVPRRARVKVLYRGRALSPRARLQEVGLTPLERFDVVGVLK
jgi:hypothetical protein